MLLRMNIIIFSKTDANGLIQCDKIKIDQFLKQQRYHNLKLIQYWSCQKLDYVKKQSARNMFKSNDNLLTFIILRFYKQMQRQKEKDKDDLHLKRSWLIKSEAAKITDQYDLDLKKLIGQGTYGKVVIGTHKVTKEVRAIKIIRKRKIKDPLTLINEIRILKQVDHPSIVRLYQIFETDKQLFLVMEYCQGGELIDLIMEGRMEEQVARKIFAEIVGAVYYCHQRKICHRDLKPENILLLNKDYSRLQIKIIDFGLSAMFTHQDRMKTLAGTIYYVSPEVLKGQYDQSCDVWSLGVILYALVAGRPPFDGQSQASIADKIKKYDYIFDQEEFKGRSQLVKDLITQILQPSEKRISCKQILEHEWLKNINYSAHSMTMTVVRKFKASSKFKILALSYLATQLGPAQIQQSTKLHDKDRDGCLSLTELSALFSESNIGLQSTLEDINQYLQIMNTSKNGKITYNQFLAATMKKHIYSDPAKLRMIFDFFDKTNKGSISFEDIANLQEYVIISKEEWQAIIKACLGKSQQSLNFEEMCRCITT